jgi:hypothetical protein
MFAQLRIKGRCALNDALYAPVAEVIRSACVRRSEPLYCMRPGIAACISSCLAL